MVMKRFLILIIGFIMSFQSIAQYRGTLHGWVVNKNDQSPIFGASVTLENTKFATLTDSLGKFTFNNIPTGTYIVKISSLGFQKAILYNVILNSGNQISTTIELIPQEMTLKEVVVGGVKKSVRAATMETPLSVQKLTSEEIRSSPGSNFDISKVVQSLPGVTGSASTSLGFRNDIIVRGGAPNENVFYLDGIEIPVINHFSTQGSAGGPQGILNVSFIDEVKLTTSAFDAKYDNALSSVFDFKQKRGNSEKLEGNIRMGATEFASTFDGPLSKNGKTTFLASARRSYLQYLFHVLDLPIRPNYWDFQYKITHQIDSKTTLTFLGVGAIDDFRFVAPRKATLQKMYALNASPSINQWSYTVGASLKKLVDKGYWNVSISRSHLNNINEKFENNLSQDKGEQTLLYRSNEIENKLRFDITKSLLGVKWTTGADIQLVQYDNYTNQLLKQFVPQPFPSTSGTASPARFIYFTDVDFKKYGAFFQMGKRFFNNRLSLSSGIRTDGNGFNTYGRDFLSRLSPRISLSYVLADHLNLNASVGRYFKLPPLTALGFKDNNGNSVNKQLDYIGSNHYVAGIEYVPSDDQRYTAEVFYKHYFNVPLSIQKGISLSNLGADFNILGNEPVSSFGKGRSYGFELFAQKKLTKRFFYVTSYSFFRSAYTNFANEYIPSAWENIHVLSAQLGYKFKRNWELGVKFRFQGGTPYTPYDSAASRVNFLALGNGVLDYTKLNSLRTKAFHSSDIRLDKKYNFKKNTLDFFIDISNWYGSMSVAPSAYYFAVNTDGSFKTIDNQPIKKDGSNGIPALADGNQVFVTPTFGFIWEF